MKRTERVIETLCVISATIAFLVGCASGVLALRELLASNGPMATAACTVSTALVTAAVALLRYVKRRRAERLAS